MSWPLSISYLNGSIHLECIDTSTSVSMLDVCIPVFFLQFFILYNLERRKKKGFLVRQQPMNGSVMMHAVGEDFADRWRKISEDVCVCVYLLVYAVGTCTNVFIQRCVCVLCVYIRIYIHGGRERSWERKRQGIAQRKTTTAAAAASGRIIYQTRKSNWAVKAKRDQIRVSQFFVFFLLLFYFFFHPHMDAGNQCQSPLRLVAIRILRI